MAVCSNCGVELEEGQKFCFECGTPVPQSKKCIKCGAELALKMKFCPECGTKQDGEPKTVNSDGFNMGNENVIAGDIIGHKEETHVAGNATIIKHEDQTKQVKKCHVCGSIVPITQGFECPECGQFTCDDCYDEKHGVCTSCAEKKSNDSVDQYKNALKEVLADGRIELSERKQLNALQQKLGIPSEVARKLENEMKNAGAEEKSLTIFEDRIYNEAKTCFYDDGNVKKALELLEPVYQKHKHDEKILDLYLPALAEVDSEKALEITGSLEIDVLSAYITEISLAVRNRDFDKAEIKIKQAMRMWQGNALVNSWRVAFYYAMYKHFSDKSFLDKAKEIAETLDETQNELELSYAVKMKAVLAEEAGEPKLDFNKEFCKENNLYWHIMQSDFCPIYFVEGNELAGLIESLKPGKYVINVSGEIDEDSFKTIHEALKNDKLEIKMNLQNTTVTEIGDYAFENCSGLTEITIPNSVTKIGYAAFRDCSGLTEITIPNSVTEIEPWAFENCSGLTEITIPNSVTKIERTAFDNCSGLTEIIVTDQNSNYASENGVLYNKAKTILLLCPEGKSGSFRISNSVTEIRGSAFRDCSGLTEITIPNSVTEIGDGAFDNCRGLTDIIVTDQNAHYTSDNGMLYNKARTILLRCLEGKSGSLKIPNSVTEIGESAFENCSELTEITIPNSVTKIERTAFDNCRGLTDIVVTDQNTHYASENGVLYNKARTILLRCPEGKSGSFRIPNSVTEIGESAFENCSGLTEIRIPNSVTKIGEAGFYYCNGLTKIRIPGGVKVIEGDTFCGCSGLTEITIPDSVTEIDCEAFLECSGLTEITISDSVKRIDSSAFWNCTSLKTAYVPKHLNVDDVFDAYTQIIRK